MFLIIFQGYSFIAPSVLFGNNAISEEIFAVNASGVNRPGDASLIYASMFEVRNASWDRQFPSLKIYLILSNYSLL